jgi:hypothetical protein
MIIYRGPSLIDGKPIVCIAVFPKGKSNSKTGPVIQTYILTDNGKHPLDNNKSGEDYSICGNCKHRGTPTTDPAKKQAVERSCYVALFQGPGQVFKTLQRGKYSTAQSPEDIANIGAERMVRMGSYGDPLAVPTQVWNALKSKALGHTGYTHQEGLKAFNASGAGNPSPSHQSGHLGPSGELAGSSYLMLSADSKEEAQTAWEQGKRTFRVIPINAKPSESLDPYNEIMCPSDKGVQCVQCKLCKGGSKGKSVAIVAHGVGRGYVRC